MLFDFSSGRALVAAICNLRGAFLSSRAVPAAVYANGANALNKSTVLLTTFEKAYV